MLLLHSDCDRDWILMEDQDDLNLDNLSISTSLDITELETRFDNCTIEERDYISLLCIDIGVVNLGLTAIICEKETYKFIDVVGVDRVDITTFLHPEGTHRCDCKLNHTRTFSDWMDHVFEYYKDVFKNVDNIIIERQPPTGFVVVEQLIYSKYRHKCYLVSPNSVHKYLGISKLNYDDRKKYMEELALKYISSPKVREEYLSFERKHDMADALGIGLYWLNQLHKVYISNSKKRVRDKWFSENCRGKYHYELGITIDEWLEYYTYSKQQKEVIL